MTIWRMRITCCIPKATHTHSEYVIVITLPYCINGCTNEPQCYVIRTLPVIFILQAIYIDPQSLDALQDFA